jgi:hypothetical protein
MNTRKVELNEPFTSPSPALSRYLSASSFQTAYSSPSHVSSPDENTSSQNPVNWPSKTVSEREKSRRLSSTPNLDTILKLERRNEREALRRTVTTTTTENSTVVARDQRAVTAEWEVEQRKSRSSDDDDNTHEVEEAQITATTPISVRVVPIHGSSNP